MGPARDWGYQDRAQGALDSLERALSRPRALPVRGILEPQEQVSSTRLWQEMGSEWPAAGPSLGQAGASEPMRVATRGTADCLDPKIIYSNIHSFNHSFTHIHSLKYSLIYSNTVTHTLIHSHI